jgi:ribosomal protein L11
VDDPGALGAVLASLQVMAKADVDDLDDHRDLGIATVKLLIAAAAFGEKLDTNMQPSDSGELVTPQACSMLQFMGRVFCAIDPAELREEASRQARKMANMSAGEIKKTIIGMAREVGLRVVEVEAA